MGVGVVAVAGVIPRSPNTASAMWAGKDKRVTIGDTGAGVLKAVLTAADLTVGAVSAATGVVATAVLTLLASGMSLGLDGVFVAVIGGTVVGATGLARR